MVPHGMGDFWSCSTLILGLLILITVYMYEEDGSYDPSREGVLGALFTTNERKIIRLLLESNEAMPAAAIAKETQLGRMTAWRVLNRLAARAS